MDTDPFSEIISLTNAQAVLAGGFKAGGPWAIAFPARDKIKLSAVLNGSCWFRLEGEDAVRLEAGDVGLLATPRPYVMASDLDIEPVEAVSLFSGAGRSMAVLGSGGDFGFIGGHIELNATNGQLLRDVIPPWLQIKSGLPEGAACQWMLSQLVEEGSVDMPGGQLASAHLAQLLFTQILRAHLKAVGTMPAGWLKVLADVRTAPALRLMHGEPGREWGLEELARACAMSRTTFANHFKSVSGKAPLTYLTEWRMRLAERALREETAAVAVIGQSLGYSSESAFSNAFKRVTGSSPRTFRRRANADRVEMAQRVRSAA